MSRRRWLRRLAPALGMGVALVLLAHPLAVAGSDVWGNVGPASPLGAAGLYGRYPLDHYMLDQHFDAVSASLTGGVDVSGVPPMIAYFLTSVLWTLTSFLANTLISLFAFAFSLDLVNGSEATGGAGALGPVSQAIHSIYADVFGAPWLVLAVAVVGIWAMWKALVQRRYTETAGALGLSLIFVVAALFFVIQPGQTIGAASSWTNRMSRAFLAVSDHGSPSGGAQARDGGAQQLFDLLVFKPWTVLQFGGIEHCALAGSGSEGSDPLSAPVRPLSSDPARDSALARRLAAGTEVAAEGKVCVNNANKYALHFLRFGLGTDERDAEYDAIDDGDSSELPEADTDKAGYRLGVADKPATDAMEEGGQYERLLLAIVVFFGELGAFLLLGALSIGVILAQVLLLLLLAFAPAALVAAAIPGRGHQFFKRWLEKLAGYLLRKAAYSLLLAILLAVNGALASATSQLGWLMSFGLQAFFFWAVFLQRRTLAESLVGSATAPGAPGRGGSLRVLGLYAGARMAVRPLRGLRRGGRAAARATGRRLGGAARDSDRRPEPPTPSPRRSEEIRGAPGERRVPRIAAPAPFARRGEPKGAGKDKEAKKKEDPGHPTSSPAPEGKKSASGTTGGKGVAKRRADSARPDSKRPPAAAGPQGKSTAPERPKRRKGKPVPPGAALVRGARPGKSVREARVGKSGESRPGAEPLSERERQRKAPRKPTPDAGKASAPRPRRGRKGIGR
jgi:hypothetical protein